jgi:enoyl-CoA hydratase
VTASGSAHLDTTAMNHIKVDAADGIAFLRINRPEKRNALDSATRAELIAALDWAGACNDVRVVVVTGAGDKAFASGADLSESANVHTALELRASLEARRVYDAVSECPKPVVAMINGHCLGGGCELALSTDIRVASHQARFGQPEIQLGIIPGGGATQRLPRLIGLGQTLRLVLTGESIDAAEALRLGLVELVVPHAQLEARTRELCANLASRSPVALKLAKQAVRAAAELPLRQGLLLEREMLCVAFTSEDRVEGVRAFLEKRQPHFTGR